MYPAQATEIPRLRLRGKRKAEDERAPMQTNSVPTASYDKLCAKCKNLHLLDALQKVAQLRETRNWPLVRGIQQGLHIADVGHQYRQLQSTDCVLCCILFASRIGSEQGLPTSEDGDEIRLFGFLGLSDLVRTPWNYRTYDSGFLAVVPRHVEFTQSNQVLKDHVQREGASILLRDGHHPAMLTAQAVPRSFDANTANRWLHYCKRYHSNLCGTLTKSQTPGLRLVDCSTLSIRAAESDDSYVALSYVWAKQGYVGRKLRRARNRRLIPARMSAVIYDAINVTKALGFRYLWVDKFCIGQNDEDRLEQVMQMNAIYENADLTIVAAAGPDETYGLPGIRQRPRPRVPQTTAKLSGLSVISTMRDPQFSIRSSHWASRGWTYQEAALTRRRLVFTDEQLYFECNAMNCFESVCSPLDMVHTRDKSKSLDAIRAGIFGRGATEKFGKLVPDKLTQCDVFQQYLSAVQDYSSRNLSYDSDSLNAFQGIIQRYSKLDRPRAVQAIWGMPYPAQGGKRIAYFCWALTWSHTQGCWEDSREPCRRKEFPSWTWAGWAGAVQIRQAVAGIMEAKNGVESVRLASREGLEEDLNSLDCTGRKPMCSVLRLLAKALPPTLFSCETKNDGNVSWAFAGKKTCLYPSQPRMLGEQFVQDLMDVSQWRCIWICSLHADSFCMVLAREHENDTWTRAGMISIKCVEFDMRPLLGDIEATWCEIE